MRIAIPVLLALVLAGCAAPAATPGPSAGATTAAAWTLDCDQGSHEKATNDSWLQLCEARASHNPGPKEENWIAINPTNPLNVVVGAKDLDPASSHKCVWNGVFVTHDGGITWRDVVIGGKYADRKLGDPAYGYACNTDPDFQFTKDGALHYGVEMYKLELPTGADGPQAPATPVSSLAEGFKILLATSHDGGDTWPDVITYQPDMVITTDYSRMTVNPATQTILEAIGSAGCNVLRSSDGGKTATFVKVASKDGIPCSSNNGAIAGSPKGTVVIVGGGIAVRSTDDGQTWLDSNPIFAFKRISQFKESKYRTGSNLELAYDLSNGTRKGTLYAVYGAADNDEADVFARASTDDGKTWSEPVRVNDDAPGSHQWMPNVAVAGDGSVHVFFMDKRYDPEHKLIDITHAYSMDGGKTWTNERVSTLSYDGDLGVHQDGFPFIGDYLGVACGASDCWAGFPDASVGGTTVTAAAHVHQTSADATA